MGESLNSLGDFLGNKLNGIRSVLGTIGNQLTYGFEDIIRNFSKQFTNFGNFIVDGIRSIFGGLIDGVLWIWDFFKNLFTWVIDLVTFMFVPESGYLSNQFDNMSNILKSKFAFINVISSLWSVTILDVNSFSIPFLMDTVISFDWYLPYRAMIKGIMSTFLIMLTLVLIIKRIRVKVVVNG